MLNFMCKWLHNVSNSRSCNLSFFTTSLPGGCFLLSVKKQQQQREKKRLKSENASFLIEPSSALLPYFASLRVFEKNAPEKHNERRYLCFFFFACAFLFLLGYVFFFFLSFYVLFFFNVPFFFFMPFLALCSVFALWVCMPSAKTHASKRA